MCPKKARADNLRAGDRQDETTLSDVQKSVAYTRLCLEVRGFACSDVTWDVTIEGGDVTCVKGDVTSTVTYHAGDVTSTVTCREGDVTSGVTCRS